MKNKKLESVKNTIAFLKSAVICGEKVTFEMREEVKGAYQKLEEVDLELQNKK